MFAPTRYIEWARRFYGKVRFDLATSGVSPVRPDEWLALELGSPGAGAANEEVNAWDRFRGAIAKYNDAPENEVIAALGTTHAFWLALSSLTSAGDGVLVEDPAYEPLLRAAQGVGANVTRFARPEASGFALDSERIASAMTPHTRVVAVSNLHNPSGTRADDERLRAAARAAEAGGAFLLVDEVYAPFDALVDDTGVFRSSARRLAENVVAVGSLTKCYGLGADRVGWLLGPSGVVLRAHDTMTSTAGILPLSHALQGLRALANIRALSSRSHAILASKRERVALWAASLDVRYSAPEEGLFGFVTLPHRKDLTAEIEAAARDHEVLVAAGAFFGIPNGFRIAWSEPEDKLEEGLARLTAALKIETR
jgi:aspartate/methionine/tyrosine aminotransferase